MPDTGRDSLLRQLDTAWNLMSFHLAGLGDEECAWRPAKRGLHVQRIGGGTWRAEWPERESYDVGPPSPAWLTWHVCFWWSMVLDHSFGTRSLSRADVAWPGSAQAVRDRIGELNARWREELGRLGDDAFASSERTRWPFRDRPFADVVAWVNVELTKNAAEIGYARFLYAVRANAPGSPA